MAAAEKTLTEVGRDHLGKYEIVTGTVTIATTLDWIVLSDHNLGSPPIYVHAHTAADGVDGEAFWDTSTPNKVFFTQTGAMRVLIIAPSLESTGGD